MKELESGSSIDDLRWFIIEGFVEYVSCYRT